MTEELNPLPTQGIQPIFELANHEPAPAAYVDQRQRSARPLRRDRRVTAECPCGGKGWMWCPECRRVDAGRLHTGIAKNCRNHRPVPTCPTCLPQPEPDFGRAISTGSTPRIGSFDDDIVDAEIIED